MQIISNLGASLSFISLLIALYGSFAAVFGGLKKKPLWVESSRRAVLTAFALLSLSTLSLVFLLVSGDFQVAYVYSVTSSSMPLYLKITALWGAQAGSLLFWAWMLAGFSAAACLRYRKENADFLPWIIAVFLVTLEFFLFLVIFVDNPFVRYWQTSTGEAKALFQPKGAFPLIPEDGSGLNPLLRHLGMVLHPPMQYLGYVAFIIPYAFAIASLITGSRNDRWLRLSRRWTLAAWLFLSLGLVLGSRWAYDVLGWGGYWGWDPVETSALMPWLSATAFLHSMTVQERKGMFKRWNIILCILTYALVLLGTFLSRSGVVSSVHAFSESAIGVFLFLFVSLVFLLSLGILLYRWNDLQAEGTVRSSLSREAFFLVNNLLFMGILLVCLWGIFYPLFSGLLTGRQAVVGPEFYERASTPLWGGLLLLMGLAPLAAWGKSTLSALGKAAWKPLAISLLVVPLCLLLGVRRPLAVLALWLAGFTLLITLFQYLRRSASRRSGGYIIHLAMVLMGLGIIGIEMLQGETQVTLNKGESLQLDGYTVTFQSLHTFDTDDGRSVARAVMEIYRGGVYKGDVSPRWDYYYDADQQVTIPGIRSTLEDDLYITLVDWENVTAPRATFHVLHNPLANWLWIGSILFVVGMLVTLLSTKTALPSEKTFPAPKEVE